MALNQRDLAGHLLGAQVDQHQMLGALLWICEKFDFESLIGFAVLSPGSRTRDGSQVDLAVLEPNQRLRRRSNQYEFLAAYEEQVGARIDGAQLPIDRERIDLERQRELLSEHDLEDVTGLDVLLPALDDLVVVLALHVADDVHRLPRGFAPRLGPQRRA